MATVLRSRFGARFAWKTEVKSLQGISNDEVYEVASTGDGLIKGRTVTGGEKSKRGKSYFMNETSTRNTNGFAARTFAWKRTLRSERRQAKANSEIAFNCSLTPGGKESDIGNRFARRDSYQKWNTKTGKEIKSDATQSSTYGTFDKCPVLFVNELAPPTPVNFDAHQSREQSSCDPALVHGAARDCAGVPTNHVTLNVVAGNAWDETRIRTTIKSTAVNFFSRFKPEKKTKVVRIRI